MSTAISNIKYQISDVKYGVSQYLTFDICYLIFVILVSGGLRLSNLDLVEFKRDEANHLLLSADFLAHPRVLAVGSESSVGVDKGPMMVYLMAVPLIFSRDPRVATGFVALLNLGAVAGCYLLTRRYFGRTAALIATLLFGVSPWAIFFSRKIFTANLFPPLTLLFFFALFAAVVDRRPWQWVWACVWMAVLLQLNFFAISYVPVLILALLLFRDRVRLPVLLVGVGLFVLFFVPYLYHDYTLSWTNLRGFLGAAGSNTRIDLDAFRLAVRAIGGDDLSALAGISFEQYLAQRPHLGWLDTVEAGLFVAGLFVVSASALRGRAKARTTNPFVVSASALKWRTTNLVLVLWFAVPVLFNTRHSVELFLHYFPLLYPVQFIIIGVFVADALRFVMQWPLPASVRLAARAAPVVVVGAIAVWQVSHTLFFFDFVDHHATDLGYDPPVKYHLAVAQKAHALAANPNPRNLVIVGDDVRPENSDVLSALDYLLSPYLAPRFLDAKRLSLVFPANHRETIFLLPPGDRPVAALLAGRARPLTESVTLPGGLATYRFFLGTPNPAQPDFPVRLGASVQLLGCDLQVTETLNGQRSTFNVQLFLYWQVLDVSAAPGNPSFFNHLVDETGRRVGQRDGLDYPPRRWNNGDVFVSFYVLPVAANATPGRYWILTGLYDYKTGVREPARAESGNALGDAVRFGPIWIGPPG